MFSVPIQQKTVRLRIILLDVGGATNLALTRVPEHRREQSEAGQPTAVLYTERFKQKILIWANGSQSCKLVLTNAAEKQFSTAKVIQEEGRKGGSSE